MSIGRLAEYDARAGTEAEVRARLREKRLAETRAIGPYLTEHAAFIRMAREYRQTNPTDGQYGLGFVRGYVARCLREAAVRREAWVRDRKFWRLKEMARKA